MTKGDMAKGITVNQFFKENVKKRLYFLNSMINTF